MGRRPLCDQIQRTSHPHPIHPHCHMQIDLRRRNILMPQQFLDRPEISPAFQQARRKRMPQGMTRHPLGDSRILRASLDRLVVNSGVAEVRDRRKFCHHDLTGDGTHSGNGGDEVMILLEGRGGVDDLGTKNKDAKTKMPFASG